jgi:hypothetical protein
MTLQHVTTWLNVECGIRVVQVQTPAEVTVHGHRLRLR